MWVYECMGGGLPAHMCLCVWEPEVNHGRCSFSAIPFGCLKQGYLLAWSSLIRLGCLGSPRDPPLPAFTALLLRWAYATTPGFFTWGLEIELRSTCLYNKYITDWAVSYIHFWTDNTILKFILYQFTGAPHPPISYSYILYVGKGDTHMWYACAEARE